MGTEKRIYKLITGDMNNFSQRLNQAVAQGAKLEGNLTAVHTTMGQNYAILTYKIQK